ncbi:MAG: 4Fe-4S binding protein [Deltaproteobacteria bacterium]|nr:4Fe-4S binding protein [Deltaproteobacteria bacterium]
MKWLPEAEAALKKVPFFVRKKVRVRVEKEAAHAGRQVVGLSDVKATQKRYLNRMSSEIKGYQLDACFGSDGCPNRTIRSDGLFKKIEKALEKADLLSFLRHHVGDNLKFHHEFRITMADCPNACSQPQIKDIGIIGACEPRIRDEVCSCCEACVDTCPDNAIKIDRNSEMPVINDRLCMLCGRCIAVCPTGTIAENKRGFKVSLGGKLGRHPRLARALPGIFNEDEVVEIVNACLDFYKQHSRKGKRFAEILTPPDFENIAQRFDKKR